MARLIVSAAASPLFGNFLMVVSVSTDAEGAPVTGLKPRNFMIADLASLNHAAALVRQIKQVTESPPGFYIVELKPWAPQPTLPPGHYVFGVAVSTGTKKSPSNGQTVAEGDLP